MLYTLNNSASWRKRLVGFHRAGTPSSHLGHSMWDSWWTKRDLGKFSSVFLPFSPTIDFIPPLLHTYLIHFVSFNFISL